MVACVCKCKGQCGDADKRSRDVHPLVAVLFMIALIGGGLGMGWVVSNDLKGGHWTDIFVTDDDLVDPLWLKERNDKNREDNYQRCMKRSMRAVSKGVVDREASEKDCRETADLWYRERDWIQVAKINNERFIKGYVVRVPR